jgi:hypothetical protein
MGLDDNKIQEVLTSIISVFSDVTCSSIEALFGKRAHLVSAWSSNKHIEIDCQYVLIMGGASDTFQSILTVGVDTATIIELTGQELEQSEFCDVFGELANTYCAMLMDRDEFTTHFGILNQTVPVLYTKGIPFLPFISGVQGTVTINGKDIYIGFAIRNK